MDEPHSQNDRPNVIIHQNLFKIAKNSMDDKEIFSEKCANYKKRKILECKNEVNGNN